MTSGSVFLVEDHDAALGIWKTQGVKNLDLIHLDAHLDFGVYAAHPISEIILKAHSVKELKEGLEKSIAYRFFQSDFSRQLNIGNYIYPAMQEGIVRNFYWVVPGKSRDLKKSLKLLRSIFKDVFRHSACLQSVRFSEKNACVKARLLGRNFIVSTLDKLPCVKQRVLLDIDSDFLLSESLSHANTNVLIGKRKPWISPLELACALKKKVKNPKLITIAYSVNGGYTPIKYRHLADELAYSFAPRQFKKQFTRSKKAAAHFCDFLKRGKKRYYWKAVALDRSYRAADNTYGLLYFSVGQLVKAEKEFLKIHKVDPKNPACLHGLGLVAFKKKDFSGAKKLFLAALRHCQGALFKNVKRQVMFNLGQAEFALGNYQSAKKGLLRFQRLEPMHPENRYLLSLIFEKTRDFKKSAKYLQDSLRLGLMRVEALERLLKIAWHLDNKNDIIKFVGLRLKEFKRLFQEKEKHKRVAPHGNSVVKRRIRKLEERLSRTQKETTHA